MYFVINYKEYCEVMGETYDKDNIPAWFTRVQKTAIQAIRKEITDTSIFPVNNAMLHQLKKRWLPQVIEGIAKQIFYTYNNEYFLNNGVFANRSYNQTQYGEGPVNREDYLNAVNTICTPAQNALLGTGWLCKKADIVFDKDKYYINYNPTYKDVNWGQIGGVIEEQEDLVEYLSDNYTSITDFLTFKTSTNTSITNLETNIESVEEVAESKQEALNGLVTFANGKFLHSNTDSGDLEWVEIKASPTGTSSAIANFITINGVEWSLPGGSESQIDYEMSDTSTNAVQNKVIKAYADTKQPLLTSTSEVTVKTINVGGVDLNQEVLTSLEQQVTQNTKDITTKANIDGTTPFTGDVTIEKNTPELKLNTSDVNDMIGISFLEKGTEKRNLIYDNSVANENDEGQDKLYFTDGNTELVIPKKNGTIAVASDYYTKEETYTQEEVDAKIATGTGLYLGWFKNTAQSLPSESEIGTWIVENWNTMEPEEGRPSTLTNNDYVYIWFPAIGEKEYYWRVKAVTEETGKVLPSVVTWKKDLEFDSDIVGLATRVTAIENKIPAEATSENKLAVESEITAEQNVRSTADKDLQSNIDTVSGNLNTEISDRETGDTNTLASAKEYADTLAKAIWETIYPVGSIYMSVNNTSPQTFFGGNWVQIVNKFLVGAGDTYEAEATGGSADAIVVSHTHTGSTSITDNGTHTHSITDPGHGHKFYATTGSGSGGGVSWLDQTKSEVWSEANTTGISINSAGSHSHTATTTISTTGNSATNANLPPYFAVYMWRRTA